MKLINAIKKIIIGLYGSLKRFPVSILLSTAAGVVLVIISEMYPMRNLNLVEILKRITAILFLGIPISLCIKLLFERKNAEKPYKLIVYYAVGAIILILYYFFLLEKFNMVSITRYTAISLALYLGFLFIPYIPNKEFFEMSIIKILTGFFTTLIYSVVLYGGLAAILFTIDKLLGVKIQGKVYYYTFLFTACIFFPSYFLAGIPLKNGVQTQDNYPKLLKVLILYIVMPLLTAYTSILYIYFIKIIVTRQWPVGLVSHLVLWYSVILAVVLFFITPIRNENKWANKFLTWSPKIILPILIMMFVSMGIRINAYGITENRYYVIVLGLWVFGIMVYFSTAKKLKNIVLPISLSLIALACVFGPLSSYSISKMSQNSRFKNILIKNDMLKDQKILASSLSISDGDKQEVSRILDYFNNNHSLNDIKYIPKGFKIEDMNKVLGFSYENKQYGTHEEFFNFINSQSGGAFNIKDYEYLFDSRANYGKNEVVNNINSSIDVVYNPESSNIFINYKGSKIYQKDLTLFAASLIENHGINPKMNTLSNDEMTLTDENEKVNVKIIFINISCNKDISTGKSKINGMDFYVLVKVK